MRAVWFLVFAILCLATLPQGKPAGKSRSWITSTFLDWVEGSPGDGGANTYVAADGTVRLINLWDLNRDGAIDIIFPHTHEHNEAVDLFIYWGRNGYTPSGRTSLPTNGAKSAAAADLNGDGFPDLVVVNNFNGTRTDLGSYIYWGSAAGYSAKRRAELPTMGGEAVAIADLNGDGALDLVFANSGLSYHVSVDDFRKSYIYWGNSRGEYDPSRRSILGTINARDVAVTDLNRDGHPDIIFANEGNTDSESGVVIYWGAQGGNFTADRSQALPGQRSSAVAVGDLDGNGYSDIAVANAFRLKGRELGMYNIVDTVAVDSFLYWGSAEGFSTSRRTALPTVGAQDVQIGDMNADKRPEVVFANGSGGASYIYWNGTSGFTPNRRTALPASSSHCAIADLNRDGLPDVVLS
ncbi:MAG: VCBS repeat-containing protein, partial [Bryobacteraceae bacterium]